MWVPDLSQSQHPCKSPLRMKAAAMTTTGNHREGERFKTKINWDHLINTPLQESRFVRLSAPLPVTSPLRDVRPSARQINYLGINRDIKSNRQKSLLHFCPTQRADYVKFWFSSCFAWKLGQTLHQTQEFRVKSPQTLKQLTKFGEIIQLENQTDAGAVRRCAANLLWQTIRLTLMLAAVKSQS